MSTEFPSKNGISRQWHVIDAEDAVVGKLASKAAMLLMGKHKPIYTPFLDTGDHVIVDQRRQGAADGPERRQEGLPAFHRLSGRTGGNQRAARARRRGPPAWWKKRFQGMLPKTKLGKQMYRKLKVYAGDKHPHAAQKPRRRWP